MTDKTAMVSVGNVPPTKRQKVRKWVLKLAVGLAILVPLIFIIAAVGAKFGLWGWGFGLGTLTMKVGPMVTMLALGVGVLSVLLAFLMKPRRGVILSALAMLVPVVTLVQMGSVKSKVDKLPLIHDITTDTQDPPVFSNVITVERAKTEKVNTLDYIGKKDLREKKLVSVLQTKAYPDIRPLILEEDPAVVFGAAKAAAKQLGWDVKSEDVGSGKIEATDTTFWYGFKDDVVIRVRPSQGGGTVLDVRSVSRVGASDMGANAYRIRAFTKLMEAN